jgi:hypothetical protein
MIRPAPHPTAVSSLICLFVITLLGTAIPAVAGVGLPPMPDASDTNAMELYRINVFYQAQKSEQERLKVAQERYDRMLTNRANLLQAIAAESADRHKLIVFQADSTPASSVDNKEPNTLMGTVLGVAVIGLCFMGFRYYLSRQDLKDGASQKP